MSTKEFTMDYRTTHLLDLISSDKILFFLDTLPQPVAWIQNSKIWINHLAQELLGYSNSDFTGIASVFSHLYPKSKHKALELSQQILNGERQNPLQFTVHCKDGTTRLVKFYVSIYADGLLCFMRDSINEDRISRMLQQNEEVARIGSWELDWITKEVFWTPGMYSLFDADPFSYKPTFPEIYQVLHPHVRMSLRKYMENAVDQQKPYDLTTQGMTFTGREIWVRIIGVPQVEMNQVVRVFGLIQDITNQKLIQDTLVSVEKDYKDMFENITIGMYRSTNDGRMLQANPALVKLNGYKTLEDFLANVKDIAREWYVDPQRRAEFLQAIETDGMVENFESEVYRHKTHERIWISETARSVHDVNGKLLYYEGSIQEITARKNAQLALHQAVEAADSANRAKSIFLANMSHELRTPLNAILGYADLLKEQFETESTVSHDLEQISVAGKHLLSLISDILDLAKIEAGRRDVNCENYSLTMLLDEINFTAEPLMYKNTNQFVLNYPEQDHEIFSDVTIIRQIMLNLLSNAAKFTHNGTVTVDVQFVELAQSEVVLIVRDTGIGIHPDQLRFLFQPFVQADPSTTRKYGGTGLGLSLSQHLADLIHGEISVQSVVDQGSEFTFRFPAFHEVCAD